MIILFFLSIQNLFCSDFSIFISQSQIRDWRTGEKTNVEFGFDFDIDEEFFIDSTFVFKLTNDSEYSLYYDRSDDLEIYFPTKNNIYLEGKLIYPFGWILDPYVSASGQTQITDMYKYQMERRVATAKFWDPIISIQSSGFTFKVPLDSINSTIFNLATTLRQVRSNEYTLLADDKKSKDIYRKPIIVKNPCNSVYFVASDGQLYHSGDFGLSFEKVDGVIYPKLNTKELIVTDDSFVNLKDNTLEYSLDDKYEGDVTFRITDIYGNYNIFTINTDVNRTGFIKLNKNYRLLILNIESSFGTSKTFKLIN